jgi:hypothetical protein
MGRFFDSGPLCRLSTESGQTWKKWKLLTSNEIWPQQDEVDKLRCAYPWTQASSMRLNFSYCSSYCTWINNSRASEQRNSFCELASRGSEIKWTRSICQIEWWSRKTVANQSFWRSQDSALGTIQWTTAPYLGFVDLLALKRQSEKARIKNFWDHLDFLSSFIKEIRISATGKQIIGFWVDFSAIDFFFSPCCCCYF